MNNLKRTIALLLTCYIITLFCLVFLLRESKEYQIHRVLHWNHYKSIASLLSPDVINNIIVMIPLGGLVGILSSRYCVLKAVLVGLFMSETMECSQLIWKRGTFDVDDLFNNTLGAAIGGILAVIIKKWIKK